jgi:glycosyltransferase involved in cell wall biosynthesis
VAGDAAVFFDPFSTDSIADALEQVLLNEKMRHRLVQAGYDRVKKFSWTRCAEETLSVLQAVARNMDISRPFNNRFEF